MLIGEFKNVFVPKDFNSNDNDIRKLGICLNGIELDINGTRCIKDMNSIEDYECE